MLLRTRPLLVGIVSVMRQVDLHSNSDGMALRGGRSSIMKAGSKVHCEVVALEKSGMHGV